MHAATFAVNGPSCMRLDTSTVRVPRVQSTATRRGRLAAPVPEHRRNGSDLHFLVTADWGGLPVWPWATPGQQKVAASAGRLARARRSAFALSLGDHFYFHGVRSVNDPRWRRTFERVFAARSLQGAGFWRIAAGNHDHKGNMSAQLAYAARPRSRWHYPALQHAWVEVLVPGERSGRDALARGGGGRGTAGAGEVHELGPSAGAEKEVVIAFILIDTVMLCGPSSSRLKPLPLATTRRWGGSDRHWAWLEATLGQVADADFIVLGESLGLERGHGLV